jgi:single-strand DNA-binding protein
MNKVIIIGNLGQDPEIRYTGSGTAVGDLSVATSHRYKDKDGQYQEETEWHKVTVWGKGAENCGKYLVKGRKVAVEGRLKTEQWEDKEGNKRYTTKIVAENVQFLRGETSNSRPSAPAPAKSGGFDDDIPF